MMHFDNVGESVLVKTIGMAAVAMSVVLEDCDDGNGDDDADGTHQTASG